MDAYVAASEGGHVFEAEAGLRKFDEVGHRDRDFSAAVGEIPV